MPAEGVTPYRFDRVSPLELPTKSATKSSPFSLLPSPFSLLLIAVVGLGFLLRGANLAATSRSPFFTRPVIDGQVYDEWAMAIKAGNAPAGPFYQDPLYPYFLALLYTVFGHRFWAVYAIQLLLGALLLWLVYDMTRLLFDRRAGIVAALLGALCKPLIFYDGQIEKTALAVFLVGLLLWAFVRALSSRRIIWPLLTGLALGLAALTRANLLIFAPLLPLVFLLQKGEVSREKEVGMREKSKIQNPKSKILSALAAAVGVIVIIAPVVIRNSVAGHELILTTTQGGQNLYIGNSPYNVTGQYAAPPWVRPNPEFEQADFQEYARKEAGRNLSNSQVSSFYVRAAIQWMRSHPGRFIALFWRKIALYFNNYEVPDNQDMYFFARYSWVLKLPLLGFGVIFGLGLAGMLLLRKKRSVYPQITQIPQIVGSSRMNDSGTENLRNLRNLRMETKDEGRRALIIFFFGYALSVVAFFVFSRYRLPSLPALLPFAGGMTIWLWDHARRLAPRPSPLAPRNLQSSIFNLHRSSSRSTEAGIEPQRRKERKESSIFNLQSSIFGCALVLLCIAPTLYPMHRGSGTWEAAQCLVNLASRYYHEGDTANAVATYEQALAENPGHAEALRNLGIIALERHNLDQAHEILTRAAQADRANPVTRHYLGKTFEQRQNLDSAYVEYRQAVNLSPGRVEYRFSLATVLQKFGQTTAAMAQYDTMISLDPNNPLVRHNYSVALYLAGRVQEAWQQLEMARKLGGAINPQYEAALRASSRGDTLSK